MVQYDPRIIYVYAERLYSTAYRTIFWHTLSAGAIGALLGGGIEYAVTHHIGLIGGIVAVLGGIAGYAQGSEQAFKLRLEAQQALCNLKIEENTSKRHLGIDSDR